MEFVEQRECTNLRSRRFWKKKLGLCEIQSYVIAMSSDIIRGH